MRRPHTFLSPLGLFLALAMILGVVVSVWFRGGKAFSPGRLSASARLNTPLGGYASHAAFEQECARCHQPGVVPQDALCLACHTNVAEQLVSAAGLHGSGLSGKQCADCHPDHRGRDFDPAVAALPFFDHTTTAFSLVWHQVNFDASLMVCQECHLADDPAFAFAPQRCVLCHGDHDPVFITQHVQDFGEVCLACHDGLDRMTHFDHAATAFPLKGKHAALACRQCHALSQSGGGQLMKASDIKNLFNDISSECSACHTEPDQHLGLFDSQCSLCHTVVAWKPASLEGRDFDHGRDTAFDLAHHALGYDQQPLGCADCHAAGLSTLDIQVCSQCHAQHDPAFMQQHEQQMGTACLECHDGRDRMRAFDHAVVFPLDGRHAQIACRECHLDGRVRNAPSECVQCHAEPPIHAGFFGLECQDCHSLDAWSPAYLRLHTFPLDHGESGRVACQVCHPVSYVEYTCYGCHEHQPDRIAQKHGEEGISAAELPDCARCHLTGLEDEAEGE